jgi:glycosyltransferase involved in cell wall biosynthesis
VVDELARGLSRRGHRVTVCATDAFAADARLPPSLRNGSPVELAVFPNLCNAAAYHLQLFLPLGLDRFLRRHARDFNVAHVHACHNLPAALAARRLEAAGVPWVLSPHGTAERIEQRQLAKWIFDRTVGRGLLERARRLFAVSESERRQLAARVEPSRVSLLPNPLALAEFDPPLQSGQFRRKLGWPDGPLVVYLGALTPSKRVDVLVRAIARLGRPSLRLAICGNDRGEERRLRRLVTELRLVDRTRFTGLLCGRDRLEALADADVVSYAGRHEAFGLVPLEAVLCGTPVVISDDAGCAEVLRSTGGGLAVPTGDEAALSQAIARVLDEPRYREEARAAARPLRCQHGGDRVCADLEARYREVIAA